MTGAASRTTSPARPEAIRALVEVGEEVKAPLGGSANSRSSAQGLCQHSILPFAFAEAVSDGSFAILLERHDLAIFHEINGWCGRSVFLDQIVNRLENHELKGLVYIGTFGALWFRRTKS
jgi:hypothetical protein